MDNEVMKGGKTVEAVNPLSVATSICADNHITPVPDDRDRKEMIYVSRETLFVRFIRWVFRVIERGEQTDFTKWRAGRNG